MGKATTKEVIREIKRIARPFSKKIDRVILFGSRAKGEEKLDSDADVIIVSDSFEGIPFKKRPDRFLDAWKLPIDLEVLCYSKEELKRKQKEIGLVREALRTGAPIVI